MPIRSTIPFRSCVAASLPPLRVKLFLGSARSETHGYVKLAKSNDRIGWFVEAPWVGLTSCGDEAVVSTDGKLSFIRPAVEQPAIAPRLMKTIHNVSKPRMPTALALPIPSRLFSQALEESIVS